MTRGRNDEINSRIQQLAPGRSFTLKVKDAAVIFLRTESGFFIEPCSGSTNVYVNNDLLLQRRSLTQNDIIRINNYELEISLTNNTNFRESGNIPPVPSVPSQNGSPLPVPDVKPNCNNHQTEVAESTLGIINGVQTVRIKGQARNILNHVTVSAQKGEFLGVVGGSGSGKSTLLKAIAGLNAINEGEILLHGHPISRSNLLSDKRIAYLPQDVVIHEMLTSNSALDYIAKLKNVGATPHERHEIIAQALKRTGMEEHANTPIRRLSGGQRKRVALAAELLGDPEIILLDEATSGLDPSTETEMMHLFKSLADDGKTVFCITHFPKHLFLCDHLLYMMKGTLIFYGTPQECLKFFDVDNIEEIYVKQNERTPEEWKQRYDMLFGPIPSPKKSEGYYDAPDENIGMNSFLKQLSILSMRYCHLQFIDVKNCFMLFLQAPVIALMIGFSYGVIPNDPGVSGLLAKQATSIKGIIFSMILSILWCSGTSSVREIVKEMPILTHEIRFGVKTGIYFLSKILFLSFFVFVQAIILLWVVQKMTELPGNFSTQLLILFFSGISGIAIGLLVSPLSKNVERAMTLLPVILIGQAIFSGGLAKLETITKYFSWLFVPAYWSLEGLIGTFSKDLREASISGRILGEGCSSTQASLILTIMSVVPLLITWYILKKDFSGGDKGSRFGANKNAHNSNVNNQGGLKKWLTGPAVALVLFLFNIGFVWYFFNIKNDEQKEPANNEIASTVELDKTDTADDTDNDNVEIIPITEPFEKRVDEAILFLDNNLDDFKRRDKYSGFIRAQYYMDLLKKTDLSVYEELEVKKRRREIENINKDIQEHKDTVNKYLREYKEKKDSTSLRKADAYLQKIISTVPSLSMDTDFIDMRAEIEKEKMDEGITVTRKEIALDLANYKNHIDDMGLIKASRKYDVMKTRVPECEKRKDVQDLYSDIDYELKKAKFMSFITEFQKTNDIVNLLEAREFVKNIKQNDLKTYESEDFKSMEKRLESLIEKENNRLKVFGQAVKDAEKSLEDYKPNNEYLEILEANKRTPQEEEVYKKIKKLYGYQEQLKNRPKKGRKAGDRHTVSIGGIEFNFRWCPPGEFMMGSPESEASRKDDETLHKVVLTQGFWILETEVTQEMYMMIMQTCPSFFVASNPALVQYFQKMNKDIRRSDTRKIPVENVSWNQAEQFCKKFEELFIPGKGKFSLPTEAQWEYACRAGNQDSYTVEQKNISVNDKMLLRNVKSFKANNWGLYEMPGSVYEWCLDWYSAYPQQEVTVDPKGPENPTEIKKVIRGGCWYLRSTSYCRSAARSSARPEGYVSGTKDIPNGVLGFRFVFNYEPEE